MAEPQNRPLRVFLCHSSSDKPAVRQLYGRLSAEGWIDVWLDVEKLYPGQDWNFEIEKAVESADVIIVCLSNNSVTKEGYVQRELRIVLDLADYKPEGTLFVIPVRLEECQPPRRLRTWQYADFFPREDQDNAYARLLVSLRMRAMRLGIPTVNSSEETVRNDVERSVSERKDEKPRRQKEDLERESQNGRQHTGNQEKDEQKREARVRNVAKEHVQKSPEERPEGGKIVRHSAQRVKPLSAQSLHSRDAIDQKKDTSFDEQEKQLAAQRSKRSIRTFGIAIVILLIAAGIWYFFPRQQAQNRAGVDYGSSAAACKPFADIPVASQYTEPPLKIDTSKQYLATVKMAKGSEFVIQLYPDKAPTAVNSFIFLACKRYFNGVTFHRVLEGFMAQGGDPTGTGTGGPGYQFENESSNLTFDKAGVVAMANAGRDTNGSQFFITFGPAPQLNGDYTIFGQVIQGMDVVNGITRRDPNQNPAFAGDAIETITITQE